MEKEVVVAPPFSSAQARSAISASLRDWNATTAIGVRPFTWNESGATPATPLRMVRWSTNLPFRGHIISPPRITVVRVDSFPA